MRLYKGNAFRLGASDFTLTFADGGNNPTIDFIVSEGDTPRGEAHLPRTLRAATSGAAEAHNAAANTSAANAEAIIRGRT